MKLSKRTYNSSYSRPLIIQFCYQSDEYRVISTYLKDTGPPKRDSAKILRIDLLQLFKLEREGEDMLYLKQYQNKSLLWCAYPFTDTVKILKEGFEFIKELPEDLYTYKKAVSFCDMANNCISSCQPNVTNDVGFLFLCEVALGEVKFTTQQSSQK